MAERSGIAIIIASLILGASLIAGSLLIQGAFDRSTQELSRVRAAIAAAADRPAAPTRAAARPAPAPSNRPDPARRYSINTKGAPARGPEDAEVTLVEFSDFQCPFCSRVTPTLRQIHDTYGDDVRIVFKHLPLRTHPKAPAAHAAAEAAHRQGKFWEMHDKIFGNQSEMSPEKYEEYAAELGLDVEQFKADVQDAEVLARIEADKNEAANLGVTGTPGFFINGRFLSGARPFESFKVLIDQEMKQG